MERVCLIGMAGNVHVQRWAQALAERGLAVSLISTAALDQPLPAPIRDLPCVTIPTARAGMTPGARLVALLRGWARVPALVAAQRPSIVHVHALPTPMAVPFLGRLRRLVVSAWGSDVVQRDRRKAWLYPRLLAHADRVTATSAFLAGVVASYLPIPRPIDVIPFGVDTARFMPADSAAAPVIGTLRHLEPIYGLDVLLDALPAIAAQVPDVTLEIGGAGSQQAALREQAARRGVEGRVRWLGRVPHAEVADRLRGWRLFVNPSRAESFGVAAIEAQACGLPVVASRVGGLPDVIDDGVSGLLVPPGDASALAAAIVALLRDPARCRAMGAAGRDRVQRRFEWQRNVDQMLALYRQVDAAWYNRPP